MADVKDQYSPASVEALAGEVHRAWARFPVERFVTLACDGLPQRELTGRIALIADALVATLPHRFADAAGVIASLLDSPTFDGWASLPVSSFVAKAGIDEPHTALPLLADLTPRFSAEFEIRAFIEAHPDVTFGYLHEWVDHPDEHVRRLVSEGTRPRLPWAPQLRRFITDPSPTIGLLDRLLDRLFDDDADYVRKSVANHLNDISKDHPDRAVEIARRWTTTSTHGDGVVRHGLRTLVKKGHPGALSLLGFPPDHDVDLVALTCTPAAITIGETVTITFVLFTATSCRAAIDYLVHYQGARGLKRPKVFKLTVRDLPAGENVRIERRHSFGHVSIRRITPGPHRIEIQVNGRILGGTDLDIAEQP